MKSNDKKVAIFMILPAIVMLTLFFAYPLIKLFYDSFFSIDLFDPSTGSFVGLENYLSLIQSERFLNVVFNTFKFVFIAVGLEFIFGFIMALLFNRKFKTHQFWRTLLLSPLMLAPVVSSLIWKFMLSNDFGLINWIFYSLGLIQNPDSIAWLSNPRLALLSCAIAEIWLSTPFMALMLLAGLQGIPKSLYESAKVDGANSFKRFIYITLPVIKPVAVTAILIKTIDVARSFDIIWNLTQGGPHFSSEVLSTYVYKMLMRYGDIGSASAISIIFTILLFLISSIFILKIWNPNK